MAEVILFPSLPPSPLPSFLFLPPLLPHITRCISKLVTEHTSSNVQYFSPLGGFGTSHRFHPLGSTGIIHSPLGGSSTLHRLRFDC